MVHRYHNEFRANDKSSPGLANPVMVIYLSILVGKTTAGAIDFYFSHEKIAPWKIRQLQNSGMTISRL